MTEEYIVRPVTEAYIDKIAELEELCFSTPMPKENLRSFLLGKTGIAFVCFDTKSENICAYGGELCIFDEAQVLNVAVHPEYRGRGLGRRITETLINAARNNGVAYLTLEVRNSNTVARRLYEGLGFYEVGRIKNYYKRPLEDGLILKLDICPLKEEDS